MSLMSLTLFCLITACQGQIDRDEARGKQETNRNDQSLYQDEDAKTRYGYENRNQNVEQEDRFLGEGQNEIGYFRYNPVNYKGKQNFTNDTDVFIDRPILAKHIASLVTVLPNVKESTVFVTDDHVFVGIMPKKGKKDAKMEKEAKRTAESLTPRYFKVHVTDSDKLENAINDLGLRMQNNGDVDGSKRSLNELLKRMGDDTPPG